MELDQKALDKAVQAYYDNDVSIDSAVADSIKVYLAEMMRPGELVVSEPIQPQRDYRKELWIATSVSHTGTAIINVEYCKTVVRGFDEFFGEQK